MATVPPKIDYGGAEALLVEQLRSGSNAAMRSFYSTYGSQLTAVCSRYLCDDTEDIKDAMQESLIAIFTKIGNFSYSGEGSLQAWASKIVANKSLTLLRERQRLRQMIEPQGDSLPDTEADLPPTGIASVPPDTLQGMIKRLPPGYRVILNMFVFEQLPHEEIARRLGITPSTSASRMHRARAMLTRQIRDYNNQNDNNP